MDKIPDDPFIEWGYSCAQWSYLDEDVPELPDDPLDWSWEHNDQTPSIGEERTVLITGPFDESLNSEFWLLFETAEIFFNGPDFTPDDISKCAVVRCRFNKILKKNDFSAWIRITVLSVIPLIDLYKYYDTVVSTQPIDELIDFDEEEICTFKYGKWVIKDGNAQGAYVQWIWIYKDEYDIQHLVMQMRSIDCNRGIKVSFGNIVNSPHT